MLLRTIVLLAVLTLLGQAIVFGCSALARMSFHAKQAAAVRVAFEDAVQQARKAAITGTLPQPSATCMYSSGNGCAIRVETAIAPATPVPGAEPTACPQTACVVYAQNNSHVSESRASYAIGEEVVAPNGDVLMRRAATVTFRRFATFPYASLVGSLDQTLDSIDVGGSGDDGGNASPMSATLIHVRYQTSGGGAATSGDVWRAQSEHPATASPGWDN